MLTMSRRVLYMVLGGIMSLVIVGAAIGGGTAVFAQDDSSPPPPTTEETVPGNGSQRGQRPDRGRWGDRGTYLAEALGISVDELEAAQEAARDAAIAQAVADGIITQEQADLRAVGQALRAYLDRDAVFADLLGLSVDEIEAAREERTLPDLIAAAGLSREEIQAAMTEARDAAIAQALADGVITQDQADQLEAMPHRGPSGPHSGQGGPRGGQGQGSPRGGQGQGGPRGGGQGNLEAPNA